MLSSVLLLSMTLIMGTALTALAERSARAVIDDATIIRQASQSNGQGQVTRR